MNPGISLKLGIAGLGGYAQNIIELVLQHGSQVSPQVCLAAVCEPQLEDHAPQVAKLRKQGVEVVRTFDELVAIEALESIWLPVPINLHVPFAKKALAAGKSVMVEKPVAGTIDELDDLIATRNSTGQPVAVGFQDIYDTLTASLKQRLLAGEFGAIQRATVRACWPRNTAYFNRAAWAGTIQHCGSWVLDSPVNNALAHPINLLLFLLGAEAPTSATPTRVEAELYRAADIENYDTASLRIHLEQAPPCLVLLTHAAAKQVGAIIEIQTERGRIIFDCHHTVYLEFEGQTQTISRDTQHLRNMLQRFAHLTRGIQSSDIALASLEVASAHTLVVNGASQACPVYPIPPAHITPSLLNDHPVQTIDHISEIFEQCAATGQMLHESGLLPFTYPAQSLDLIGYNHFSGPPPQAQPILS